MSTSVWSGDMPRSVAGRMASVASVFDGRGKSIEGAMLAMAVASCGVPCCCRLAPVNTSTGAVESSCERPTTREPVTTMSFWPSASCARAAVGTAMAKAARLMEVRKRVDVIELNLMAFSFLSGVAAF